MILLQICDISMYLIVGIVVYRYTGDMVESPALGSASTTVKKAAWGVALPTVRSKHVLSMKRRPTDRIPPDHHSRRDIRSRGGKIHLRPHFPRYETHQPTNEAIHDRLDRNHIESLDNRLDHCRVDPELQRPARSDFVPLRVVVHLRHLRYLLALHELGPMVRELEED